MFFILLIFVYKLSFICEICGCFLIFYLQPVTCSLLFLSSPARPPWAEAILVGVPFFVEVVPVVLGVIDAVGVRDFAAPATEHKINFYSGYDGE